MTMKKVFFASLFALAFCASAFASPNTVNEKVLKAFNQTFISAQDVRWSQHNGMYEAHFNFNDIVTRVTYDADGNAVQTIRYYYEQQLPLNILARVKSTYEGQKIFGVTELTTNEGTEYHIVLESPHSWTTVVADNTGNLSVEKKMRNA